MPQKTGLGEYEERTEPEDRERIHATFEHGSNGFSEEDMEKLKAERETAERKSTHLGEQIESFRLTWNLLQDYWSGDYKAIPWKLAASVGFAVTYLVSPLDIIPDFLPLLGFTDDAAVFALVISSFQSELDTYKEWKKNQPK